jgi:hypothetical protein
MMSGKSLSKSHAISLSWTPIWRADADRGTRQDRDPQVDLYAFNLRSPIPLRRDDQVPM